MLQTSAASNGMIDVSGAGVEVLRSYATPTVAYFVTCREATKVAAQHGSPPV